MIRIPHERYVKTLVAGRLDPPEILARLKRDSLDFPLPGVQKIRDELEQEQPDYFSNKRTSVEYEWLSNWGIDEMYGHIFGVHVPSIDPSHVKGAFKILNDPLMSRLVSSLAMANINSEDIELIVNGKYNVEYSHENVELFLKYFFDVASFSFAEKKMLVNAVTDPDLKRFYRIALKGDKDYLLWKLGAAPEKSFDSMLKDMMSDSYYNFKERSRVDPELAQRWGALAVKLSDRIDRILQETQSNENLFEEIEFKLSEAKDSQAPIKHIDDIENKEK